MITKYFAGALFALTAMPLWAGAFSTASVMTASPGGANPCVLSSLGSQVLCMSPGGGTALAQASAGAFAASVTASTGNNPAPGSLERATATAGFDTWLIVTGGTGPGTLIGRYLVNSSSDGGLALSLFQAGVAGPLVRAGIGGTLSLQPAAIASAFVYGVPFQIAASLSAVAGLPGDFENASVQFTGFTDPAGLPLSAAVVPEPAPPLLFLLGCCAGFLIWWRNRGGADHPTAKKRFPQSRHL